MFGELGEKLSYSVVMNPAESLLGWSKIGKAAQEATAQTEKSLASAKRQVEELTIAATRAETAALRAEARATRAIGGNLEQALGGEASALRAKANRLGADLGGAKTALTDLEGQAGKTGGALASMGAIGSLGPAAIAAGAIAATTAVVDFGVKSVEAYVAGASAARQFQTISKASAEDSSRFAYAARHTGTDIEALARGIYMLGKNVANHADVLKADGIEIARNRQGHVDLAATLVNVADKYAHTADGAQAAKIGSDALGRSFVQLAPLIGRGGDAMKYFFEQAAEHGQIFSEQDLQRAAAFKIGMEALKGEMTKLQVQAGRPLTHELEMIAFGLERVIHDIEEAPKHIPGLSFAFKAFGFALQTLPVVNTALALGQLGKAQADAAEKTAAGVQAQQDFADATDKATKAIRDEYDALLAVPDAATKLVDAEDAVGAALQKQKDDIQAVANAKTAITDAEQAAADAATAETDARHKLNEAQQKYNEVLADTDAVTKELQHDQDALNKAIDSHNSALTEQIKAQDAVNLLLLKGAGVNSLALREARDKLAAANDNVTSTDHAQADAAETLAQANAGNTQHAKDLAAASDALETASRGVESAHRAEVRAVEAVDKARQNYQKTLQTQETDNRNLEKAIAAVQKAAEDYADAVAKSQGKAQASTADAAINMLFALGVVGAKYPEVAKIVEDSVARIRAAQSQSAADNPPPPPPGLLPVPQQPGGELPAVSGAKQAQAAAQQGYARPTAAPTTVVNNTVNQYISNPEPMAAANEAARKTYLALPRR